jgi:hypothetical protein
MNMRPLLALLPLLLAACGEPPAPAKGHTHKPKYGGVLVELGDHFASVEFVRSGETLVLHVLDAHAERPVRIPAEFVRVVVNGTAIDLMAVGSALTGEMPGDTSQFEAADEALRAPVLKGRIERIEVRGRAFADVAFELR